MALQNYSKLEYRQMKAAEEILSYASDTFASAKSEAEKVARICSGCFDWQGVREFATNHGLARLANKWLSENGKNCRVYEDQYQGYSIYCPTFPQVK